MDKIIAKAPRGRNHKPRVIALGVKGVNPIK
jgi:hypothetical protein